MRCFTVALLPLGNMVLHLRLILSRSKIESPHFKMPLTALDLSASIFESSLPLEFRESVRAWFFYFLHNPEHRHPWRWATGPDDDTEQAVLSMIPYQRSRRNIVSLIYRMSACLLAATVISYGLYTAWVWRDFQPSHGSSEASESESSGEEDSLRETWNYSDDEWTDGPSHYA